MKSLGICIPTYKRPAFLRRCVLSAIESAQGRPIRVFIADDSTSDTNDAVLSELVAAYPIVQVHRNRVNLGIDDNIQQVVELCDCDYAWLIGEDDRFLPGAVARMVDFLQDCTDPFIFANYQYVSDDHQHVIGWALEGVQDGEVAAASFITESLWAVGFIGSTVVDVQAWKRTSAAPFKGTYFTHVGRVLEMLAGHRTLQLRAQPSISNRAQGDDTFTWKKDSFGVLLGFERMCQTAAQRNPTLQAAIRQAAENYRRKFAYLSIKTTFRLRSEGAFDWRQFRVYIAESSTIEPWRKAWLMLLALTPCTLLKPLAKAYVAYATRRQRASVRHAE